MLGHFCKYFVENRYIVFDYLGLKFHHIRFMLIINSDFGIGRKIAKLRKAKGLTQEELAVKVGVSRVHLVKVEAGQRKVSWRVLAMIARELRVSLKELLTDKES